MEILKKYPFPKDMKAMRIDKITELLKSATKDSVGISKATLICEAAENSIRVSAGLDGDKYRL
ncbi:hypothetical protein [Clostridium saccharoperbutylacetonicum]|uniref:hypothetical protein n=1 Tax=Clostridium saccharoperbutylacetonicum TaxID=36745 RepID=UPI00098405F3|nr:hypothetical protein [Clostridium saccharoperbutylacetonicum]AQR96120.1 hypothetical protein CLSAP_34390 [Clostridium saccharoperbutylacetonicum]